MLEVKRYHPLLVALHWVLAVLIMAALGLGASVMVNIPNTSPMKIEALRSHMAAGAIIFALMIARLFVRIHTTHPMAATAGNAWLDRFAGISHRAVYLIVIEMAASGLMMAVQTGLPAIVFGRHGTLPPDFWAFPVRSVHYLLSRLLMALIAVHVAAALYHAFVLHDGLFGRMFFGRRRLNT